MKLFTVDKTKCKGDGICAAVCPLEIIRMDELAHLPVPVAGAEELCIQCGHCVCACPHGAFSLTSMPLEQCPELPAQWRIVPEKLETFLKARRSIRGYQEKAVKREILEKLIDTSRYAPSGINRQPVRWIVICEKEKVQRLAELTVDWMRILINEGSPLAESLRMADIVSGWDKGKDRICRGAPHIVLAYSLKEDMAAAQACTISLTYFELATASYGLGACWAGYVNMAVNMYEAARQLVAMPKRCSCFGAMLLGYPKYNYARIPRRNAPRVLWR